MHWRAEWRRWATTGVLATCGAPTDPDRPEQDQDARVRLPEADLGVGTVGPHVDEVAVRQVRSWKAA